MELPLRLVAADPLREGRGRVTEHGFRWVMIRSGRSWKCGVEHHTLDRPIDLYALEDGSWDQEEYVQPPCPGKMTHDSLETIVGRVRDLARHAEPGAAADPARGIGPRDP
jgi:hypothetical protein